MCPSRSIPDRGSERGGHGPTRPLSAALLDPRTLVHGDRRVRLSSREHPLVAQLLEQWPAPMHASQVRRLLWPSCSPSEATRRRTIAQLRRRLATVGLALRCRPNAGYTLEVSPWVLDVAARSNSSC